MVQKVARLLDGISHWCGTISGYLILALTGVMALEVMMRYLFKNPTVFAYDMSWMLFGAYIALGAGYSHLHKAHVRIDFFYNQVSPQKQTLLEIILSVIFFFPLLTVIIIYLGDNVIYSWSSGEHASASIWRPPVYPFKTIVLFGFIVLYLQGFSELLKNILLAVKGNSDEH